MQLYANNSYISNMFQFKNLFEGDENSKQMESWKDNGLVNFRRLIVVW